MTDDAIMRSIYFAADATSADLDRLLAPMREQRSRHRQRLEQIVAGLDRVTAAEDQPPPEHHERPADRRPPQTPDPQPFVVLPQRTTHGGPFGPKVRAKLVREALEESPW